MARFVIISDPNYKAGGNCDFRVHREECADIKRHTSMPGFRLAGGTGTREAPDAAAVVAAEVAALSGQYEDGYPAASDFHVCGCCKPAPAARFAEPRLPDHMADRHDGGPT